MATDEQVKVRRGDRTATNAEAVAGWDGPYVSSEGQLTDSWGNPFKIMSDGGRIVVSSGEDGEFGTRDDMKGGLSDRRERCKGR